MNMKKWKVLLGMVALSLGLLFTVGSSSSVNAATWHHQTPKVLRGKWRSSTGHYYFIHKHSIVDAQAQSDSYTWKVTKTTKHGRYYHIHGYEYMGEYYHTTFTFRRLSPNKITGSLWNKKRVVFYRY